MVRYVPLEADLARNHALAQRQQELVDGSTKRSAGHTASGLVDNSRRQLRYQLRLQLFGTLVRFFARGWMLEDLQAQFQRLLAIALTD